MTNIWIMGDNLEKYVAKKLQVELNYCPIISEEKTFKFKDLIPEKITLPQEARQYLTDEPEEYENSPSITGSHNEELDYLKEQAKAIGEEVEKRFRKVLSEFFEKRE